MQHASTLFSLSLSLSLLFSLFLSNFLPSHLPFHHRPPFQNVFPRQVIIPFFLFLSLQRSSNVQEGPNDKLFFESKVYVQERSNKSSSTKVPTSCELSRARWRRE